MLLLHTIVNPAIINENSVRGPLMYIEEFDEAVNRTKEFGLVVPPVLPDPQKRFFTKETMHELLKALFKTIGQPGPEDLSARCFEINHGIKLVIDDFYKTTSVFTLGWVDEPSNCLCKCTEEELKNLLVKGISNTTLGLHAWITMPSMEIFDVTINTKIALANDKPELVYAISARHVDDLSEGFAYHPMLLGDDYLNRLGLYLY
jgi:hypothetical protein